MWTSGRPPLKRSRSAPIPGLIQRLQLQQKVQQQSVCTKEVIERVGASTINDIYHYYTERLQADSRLVDCTLTRTRYVEHEVITRTDLDIKAKKEIIRTQRDQHLGKILNNMYSQWKRCDSNIRTDNLDDYFQSRVNQAIVDYLARIPQDLNS